MWSAGVEIVHYLAETWGDRLCGKHILELGAGTGSTAIALAKFMDARVVATDTNDELLDLIKENAESNGVSLATLAVHPFTWGDSLDAVSKLSATGNFDIVIGAEVTALEEGHGPLVKTLSELLSNPNTEALLVTHACVTIIDCSGATSVGGDGNDEVEIVRGGFNGRGVGDI